MRSYGEQDLQNRRNKFIKDYVIYKNWAHLPVFNKNFLWRNNVWINIFVI